jgi:uncharacterized protein YneF (UPF0154 family)
MQKKNIYFLIFIVVALLVGGTLGYYYSKKLEKAPVSQQQLSKIPVSQEQLSKIIEKRDLAACDKISTEEDAVICRDTITSLLTKEKLDNSFCKKLDGKENQANCQKAVFYDKAEKEGVEVCQQAGTEQEKRDCEKEYYFTMAIQKNDVSQCDNLGNKKDINECQKDFSEWRIK